MLKYLFLFFIGVAAVLVLSLVYTAFGLTGLYILSAVFLLWFIWLRYINTARLRAVYKSYGIVTVGKRGKGKDVLHAFLTHNKPHYSNIYYNDKTHLIDLKALEIGISPDMLLTGNYTADTARKVLKDGVPVFVSDGGIYLPSWLDSSLKKHYPSMPVSYALWRQLYDSGLHINTQVFSRLWLLLREQAECCVMCLGVRFLGFKKFGWVYGKIRIYERWQDCENGLKPLKNRSAMPLASASGDVQKVENSRRGEIKQYSYLFPIRWLKFDTRDFHKKIFGVSASDLNQGSN